MCDNEEQDEEKVYTVYLKMPVTDTGVWNDDDDDGGDVTRIYICIL